MISVILDDFILTRETALYWIVPQKDYLDQQLLQGAKYIKGNHTAEEVILVLMFMVID